MAAAKKDTLTTRFDPELLEQLRAVAWWRRSSQREVLEEGLQQVLDGMDPEELEKALQKYRESQKDD
jgi:hypothetical protein